jgi:hypothetical protein
VRELNQGNASDNMRIDAYLKKIEEMKNATDQDKG